MNFLTTMAIQNYRLMTTIRIKHLSVNRAYQGRRFKTPELKAYQQEVNYLLPKTLKIPKGKLRIFYHFGVSSKATDLDNCIKALQDILAEKYQFNDKMIYHLEAIKSDVKKGEEFIQFEIQS